MHDDTALNRCGTPLITIYYERDKATMLHTCSGRLVSVKRPHRKIGARIKDPEKLARLYAEAPPLKERPPLLIWIGTAALVLSWVAIVAAGVALWN